jgi:dCMP deaminase
MRPSVDVWFCQLAKLVAARSTCTRAQVGCVLAKGNRLLAIGYGGSAPGEAHCTDVGCLMGETGGCVRTIHAERNALLSARDHGVNVRGSTAYVTLSPCAPCFWALRDARVGRIVYLERYRKADHLDEQCHQMAGIRLGT